MLDRIHHLLRGENVRRSVRDKFIRAIAEAMEPFQHEQRERLDRLEHELRQDAKHAFDRLVEFEIRSRRDIVYAADQEAAIEANRFVRNHMPTAPHFGDPHATLEHALSLAPAEGMALEFGVYTGTTLKIIAAARAGEVYGFDSFKGLPEDWRNGFPAGTFTVDGLPDVSGAELVPGWFDETLPEFLDEHPGPVGFLHVDGDLYSSAKTVLDLVGPRLVDGSIVVFDEFFNYPGWQRHEYRAWMEYVGETGVEFTYEGYTYSDEQVIVRIGGR
ncbi:class I SAM-dependent methyltransferase [Saccharothrix sp. AJ9571]|nr:class I SAM-dependent methyltransferase [Saccharothrix sp. AJ9571]